MTKSLFIGRWQPFHAGHKALIDSVLSEGKEVVVAIRDTPFGPNNPYSTYDRTKMIHSVYGNEVETIVIPDIAEVVHGRGVGWGVRELELPDHIEEISGTKVRERLNGGTILWLTGNSGAGKTTLANQLKALIGENAVILDGDEMRLSISVDEGFSFQDREKHNKRVARLAKVLESRGHFVIVSVIAPSRAIRRAVERICRPSWVFVQRKLKPDTERPYEAPTHPDIIVNHDKMTPLESAQHVIMEWSKKHGKA